MGRLDDSANVSWCFTYAMFDSCILVLTQMERIPAVDKTPSNTV